MTPKQTFAQWEKEVRMLDDTITIQTELDEQGAVVRAWTGHGLSWESNDLSHEYAVAEYWGHIFTDEETGKEREYGTRFVADTETQKLLYAEIQWNANGGFVPASVDEMLDIEDSVISANDAINHPEDFEIELTNVLPEWAETLNSKKGLSI